MGNIDSIPVVSQAKSLVQVIFGDAKAAKETQENFARTGIVVSQFNSLGQTIAGYPDEARKIQEEFGKELVSVGESFPVVGHAMSAGYAIAGDTKKAEQVALGATKSTVVTLGAIAGVACAAGAPACGAALATSTNALWDVSESVIAGEDRGLVAGIGKILGGKASAGDVFDTVVGQVMLVGGGAMSAHGVGKGISKAGGFKKAVKGKTRQVVQKVKSMGKTIKNKFRCKRSIDAFEVFSNQPEELPDYAMKTLPGSIHDLDSVRWGDMDQSINAIFSIFLIVKLLMVGHPQSKGYLEEVCGMAYPSLKLQECEEQLILSIEKYNQGEFDPKTAGPFEDSLNALVFEMNQMVRNTTHGQGIITAICYNHRALFSKCKNKFVVALNKLKEVSQFLNSRASKSRAKRCILRNGKFKVLESFERKHVYSDQQFNSYYGKQLLDVNEHNNIINKRGPYGTRDYASRNTIIKQSDASNLLANSGRDPLSGKWVTNNKVDVIQVDTITGVIQNKRGYLRYNVDPKNGVFHMDPPIFT